VLRLASAFEVVLGDEVLRVVGEVVSSTTGLGVLSGLTSKMAAAGLIVSMVPAAALRELAITFLIVGREPSPRRVVAARAQF